MRSHIQIQNSTNWLNALIQGYGLGVPKLVKSESLHSPKRKWGTDADEAKWYEACNRREIMYTYIGSVWMSDWIQRILILLPFTLEFSLSSLVALHFNESPFYFRSGFTSILN